MKIRFTQKRLRYYWVFGIIWLLLAAIGFLFNAGHFLNYGYLIMGVLYFGTYVFENHNQYLTIENGVISKNHLISKSINLNDITRIKKFAGDYTLMSDSTELIINTQLIEDNSLLELNKVLDNLNLQRD